MTAQALYLKYRPQTFDDVVGQEPITRTLRNALRQFWGWDEITFQLPFDLAQQRAAARMERLLGP